ncbi:peptide transporter, partial [Gluconobacter japonicus]
MNSASDPSTPSPVEHRLNEADQSLRAGDAHKALTLLAPLPNSPAVHLNRGRAFFRLGQYQAAATELEKATLPFGGHAVAAVIDEAVGLRRRADLLHLFSESRKIAPHDPRLLDAQGNILMHLGRFDEAEVCLRESLERRPNDKGTLNLLAMNLTEQGRFDEALSILDSLRQRAPEEWGPGCNMAAILNNIGRLEDAANIYRETIPLAPNEAALRLNHSIAMLKSGRMAQGWAEHEWRFGMPGHTNLPQNRLLPNITPFLDLK